MNMGERYYCLNHPEREVSLADDHAEHCDECLAAAEELRAESAWERMQEGECFRGGKAAAYAAEQMEKARRLK
jgi:hypothetical protein